MCLRRLRLSWRLLPSRLVGGPRLSPAVAASAFVVKSPTQALQLVDQRRALRAHPVATALTAPCLRGAVEARVVLNITHVQTLSATAAEGGAFVTG